ncbi:DUF72 domain-containing protein [Mesorhizobium sp. SP-1A]|uniref:DUF72 domain-containing protein n=1 Tax=Mesorhizobium sp. SP-1A TaxID=3077840 RepID=UPI0028F72551|nr:DUF72 domain-containing protein [Mesorhizobium sp. SP-1A]
MAGRDFFIGTAGWSIASRYRQDFPEAGTHLQRYGGRLRAVEINSSFYRPHRRETYARWADAVPAGFRFSAKLPKTITHEHRLKDCRALLDGFFEQAGGLGEKLGVVLVQLPPSLRFEAPAAESFLGELRQRTEAGLALEPRHASWFGVEIEALLRRFRVARVAADPPPHPTASEPGGSPHLAYFRLHGSPRIYYSAYDDRALAAIAARLERSRAAGAETWCIFDNTAEGHALQNALHVDAAVDGGAAAAKRGAPQPDQITFNSRKGRPSATRS